MLVCFLTFGAAAQAQILLGEDVLEQWRPAAQEPGLEIDHGPWSELLAIYLVENQQTGINLFDYAAVTAPDLQRLNTYIDSLALIPVAQLTPLQQQAYWINLYNALTVQLILENPDVSSIREIKSGWFSLGPWAREVVMIDGDALTLDDIEHRILRPIFGDPRVHFGVNCASIGCPNLGAEPYLASTLGQQLDEATRTFINNPRGVSITGNTLTLSSIFKWYGDDFGEDPAARIAWIGRYASPALAAQLEGWDGRVRYDYDWTLNAPQH
jgi:hypothetical protein